MIRAGIAASITACPAGLALVDRAASAPALLSPVLQVLGFALALSPLALIFGAWALKSMVSSSSGSLTVAGDSLRIERIGKRAITVPIENLESGVLRAGPAAHITLSSGTVIEASVENMQVGEVLLESIGLDPASRTMTVKLRRLFYTLLYWLAVTPVFVTLSTIASLVLARRFGVDASASWPAWCGLSASLLILTTLGARFLGPNITVGADGVRVNYGFGSRFFSLADILTANYGNGLITLSLRDGRMERIWANSDSDPTPTAIVARIEQARSAMARVTSTAVSARALAREGRSIAEWRKAMKDVIDLAGGYRSEAVSREDLRHVVADASASLEHRIGAALALAASGDIADRERVRVAADASASEPIRVALSRAADGTLDEGEVEAAIEAAGARSVAE